MVEPTGHCPYLGLKQNQAIRFASPTPEHRCYAAGQAQEIPLHPPDYQLSYCLSPNHIKCPLYTGSGLPSTAALIPDPHPEPALASVGGLGGWLAGLPLRDRLIYMTLLALLAIILTIYAVAGFGLLTGGGPSLPLSPAAIATETSSPTTAPPPSPAPSATATAAPTTAAPTATLRATATGTPSATVTATGTITATSTGLPTIESITATPEPPTRRPTPPPPPPPTNTPSDLIPLPPDTPTPVVEPSSTAEVTPEPTAEQPQPTAEQPQPTAEQPQPTAEQPQPTAEQPPEPTAEQPPPEPSPTPNF